MRMPNHTERLQMSNTAGLVQFTTYDSAFLFIHDDGPLWFGNCLAESNGLYSDLVILQHYKTQRCLDGDPTSSRSS